MKSKRTRILLGILLVYVAGSAFLLYRVLADLDPRYRESAEESMVETAYLVATLVEQEVRDGAIATERLRPLFDALYAKRFEARIYGVTKQKVELRVYVTDARGRVLFDSTGRAAGADFSRWNDVVLALRGHYGARSTEGDDPGGSVMYVAAPVRAGGAIVGAVSVGKPASSFRQFVAEARRKTILVGVFSAVGVLVLAAIVSLWLVRPFGLVTEYVRYVRTERRLNLRGLWRRGAGALRAAYQEMGDALAGRSYVADYVQTLTHELKSPLSAIRGAAELLEDPRMPAAERARFLANISRETARIQQVVDRMLELTALESRRALGTLAPVPLRPLLEELVAGAAPAAALRQVAVVLEPGDDAVVEGDAFLLRQAVSNLLENAVDFSPDGGEVRVALESSRRQAVVRVRDAGPGIPPYAQAKVFEKFYSLPRPHTGKKSTGLGLSFVQRIAALHRGGIALANHAEGGAVATLSLPRHDLR
ncbi:MAG: two-component system sensor histidine kinase CreC [Ramlibacter sp.]